MTEKKLPTGVGKKIVEALKKQNELDLELEENQEDTMTVSTDNADFDEVNEDDLNTFESLIDDEPTEDTELSEEEFVSFQENEPVITEPVEEVQEENRVQDITQTAQQAFGQAEENYDDIDAQNEFSMPSNVNVLKKLISQLPTGVTKQTGAQIIRQTMEALGISMNSVLAEAQHVQDGLNDSIKDCMSTVNEYKQNIMTLEKQVVDYQKQVKSINDLISLFILTDK